MQKLQFVIRGAESATTESFKRRVIEALVPRVLEREPAGLKVTYTAADPPRLAVVPYQRRRVAVVSVWEEDERAGEVDWSPLMAGPGEELAAGYRVDETVPMAVPRDWADGHTTPGVVLLTLFQRKPGVSDEAFFARWFDEHGPMTLRNQPNWGYIRNAVKEPVVVGSPPFAGIVEEHFRDPADLFDPVLFFGGAWAPDRSRGRCLLRVPGHMVAMLRSVNRFLDLRTLESYLAEELIAKS